MGPLGGTRRLVGRRGARRAPEAGGARRHGGGGGGGGRPGPGPGPGAAVGEDGAVPVGRAARPAARPPRPALPAEDGGLRPGAGGRGLLPAAVVAPLAAHRLREASAGPRPGLALLRALPQPPPAGPAAPPRVGRGRGGVCQRRRAGAGAEQGRSPIPSRAGPGGRGRSAARPTLTPLFVPSRAAVGRHSAVPAVPVRPAGEQGVAAKVTDRGGVAQPQSQVSRSGWKIRQRE